MDAFHDKFFNLGIVGKFFMDPIMHSVSTDVKLKLKKNKRCSSTYIKGVSVYKTRVVVFVIHENLKY